MNRILFPKGIDRGLFLRDYWQKRPLLMRSALPSKAFPLTADELAGLACEPEIESRLIIQQDNDWLVRHGPMAEEDFQSLAEEKWTLLVQDVDKVLPEVADLLDVFDFVPAWRIDDIMISYATHQGGVGPHTDAYDVFLIQAEGRRRWRISYQTYDDKDLLPDLEQKILSRFDADEDWMLEPGDILYLPPGVAHWGIAEGECMTYSLGFRAPNQQEIAADWFQYLVDRTDKQRLEDPRDLNEQHLVQLTAGTFENVKGLLRTLPDENSPEFKVWLGQHLTEPKPHLQIDPPEHTLDRAEVRQRAAQGKTLLRHPCARLCWAKIEDERLALFFNGDYLSMPGHASDLADALCRSRRIADDMILNLLDGENTAATALVQLINQGIFEWEIRI